MNPTQDPQAHTDNPEPQTSGTIPTRQIPDIPPIAPIAPPLPDGTANTPLQQPILMSKADFEGQQHQKNKRKKLFILFGCLFVVLSGGGLGFAYWYTHQDHSIYAPLSTETYNQGGIKFQFKYPSILKPTTTLSNESADFKVAYLRDQGGDQVVVDAGVLPIDQILQSLHLTPTQLLAQIKAQSGSFVDAFKKVSPNGYDALYGACHAMITTASGQNDLFCVNTSSGTYTNVAVIGADTNNQYILQLYMTNDLWKNHPHVWQAVEKSFKFD